MTNKLSYTTFRTKLGWFGFCSTEDALLRACLPCKTQDQANQYLLSRLENAKKAPMLNLPLQDKICSYFDGSKVHFTDVQVDLSGLTDFQQQILRTLRTISYGNKTTYADLAKTARRPKAVRAVGGVMAANPLPLILPCHRVLRTDGKLGGFSAQGGTDMKQRMLELEKS